MSLATQVQALATRVAAEFNALRTTLSQRTPTGMVIMYGAAAAPTGWLICDGALVSKTTYAALYAVIGDQYDVAGGRAVRGDGMFRLPDVMDRLPAGAKDDGPGIGGSMSVLGSMEGHWSKTLTTAMLPSHTHGMSHGHTIRGRPQSGSLTSIVSQGGGTASIVSMSGAVEDYSGSTGSAGSGDSTPVDNPRTAFNFLIKT